jgi:hypothetical protein
MPIHDQGSHQTKNKEFSQFDKEYLQKPIYLILYLMVRNSKFPCLDQKGKESPLIIAFLYHTGTLD